MPLSKLLAEYLVVSAVNDRFIVDDVASTGPYTVTLTAARYRDFIAVDAEIDTQIATHGGFNAAVVASVSNAGIITFTGGSNWVMDWNTGTFGTTLRNDLGFTGSESVTDVGGGLWTLVGTSAHLGGFYPSEPIESDSRPDEDGTDTWQNDSAQSEGKTGVIATTGGTNRIHSRNITILLPQTDLVAFELWMRRAGQGHSFAFYHDVDQAWSGPSSEYNEYKLIAGEDAGITYAPEPVDPTNKLWHRQTLVMQQYVAPTP